MRAKGKEALCLPAAKIFFLAVSFLLAPKILYAEEGHGRYISESLQMDLADHFFKDGDYYRAITEYKRFLFFFPQSLRNEEALWKIAKSYFHGKKWDEALTACDDLMKRFPHSAWKTEALLLKGLTFAEKKEYSQARYFFQKVQENSPALPISDEAQLQMALTYLKEEKWKEAADEFRKINRNSRLYPRGEYLAQGLDRIHEIPQKSPAAAGILAAILPGAGHLYCERYRDASIAFLLNGIFIWGMVEAFEDKNYALGGILTFFELGWYSGNIYSAVSSAHKYNRKKRQEYIKLLERGRNLSMGISFQEKKPFLSLDYAF